MPIAALCIAPPVRYTCSATNLARQTSLFGIGGRPPAYRPRRRRNRPEDRDRRRQVHHPQALRRSGDRRRRLFRDPGRISDDPLALHPVDGLHDRPFERDGARQQGLLARTPTPSVRDKFNVAITAGNWQWCPRAGGGEAKMQNRWVALALVGCVSLEACSSRPREFEPTL